MPIGNEVEVTRAAAADELLEMGDALLEVDADWRIVRVNLNQERLSRKPRTQSIGRTLWNVFPEIASPATEYWRQYHRCMTDRVPVQFQDYYAPLDMWTGVTAYPTSTGGIAIFFRDISLMKVAQHEQERLADIVESTDDAIISKDLRGMVLTWNPGAERLFGYTANEMIGTPIARLLPADRPDEEDRILRELRAGRRVDHFETERLRKDGAIVAVAVTVSPLFDDAGEIRGASKIARDITERKRAERALGENIAKLRAAQQQVMEADRRKNEFLGVLSHECRNVLAPIRNSIFLLERVPSGGPQAVRARQAIRRQTEHLTRLIDDLLDVTRIERGKIRLERDVVDLRNVVGRTSEDHRALFEDAEIELHLDFPAGPVWADVDATRIRQVISNLLSNAKKFTPAHGAVTVVLRKRDGHACVCIRDTGAGIDPRQLEHMFEPFAQEDRTAANTRGGLGLGLALSKGFVELHGGKITARSEGPGKGAEFEITFPLASQAVDAPLTPPATVSTHPVRVLIIEDNSDAALTLRDVMEVMGHEVTIARDGRTGIELARETRPDVVVCDLGLPDIEGYEVASTLRQEPAFRSTRLIALSGYAQLDDKERARAAGFDAHLAKPAPLEELAAMLADA